MSNHYVKFYTILQIISYVIEKHVGEKHVGEKHVGEKHVGEKHVGEDDILFTKPLAGKGLMQYSYFQCNTKT